MESDILEVADYALEQPGVSGYICVDSNGLCLAAKGQAQQSMSGIIHQLATLASKIEEPSQNGNVTASTNPPVIRVDLERHKLLIQSRDSITTAFISPQN